ncbi:hypothetical protein HK097_000332 [Rhizophlyctis rosea]|uniref:3'-5' exonuclease domain-containing protein n=1 Tax=Rhizophlyctis rosea TaxID=64517 RepID=A0AAD5S6W0_9FUNG|nr:hypothetical protein HK097_000332 [Rhizophlyctis rosea]
MAAPVARLTIHEEDEYMNECRNNLLANSAITQKYHTWIAPQIHPSLGPLPYPHVKVLSSSDPIRLEEIFATEFYEWKNYERVPRYPYVALDCEFFHGQNNEPFNALTQLAVRRRPNACHIVVAQTSWLKVIPPSFRLLLLDHRVIKLTHNGKHDTNSIRKWVSPTGEHLACRSFLDIHHIARLLWSLKGNAAKASKRTIPSLTSLTEEFLGISLPDPRAPRGRTWADEDILAKMMVYAVKDAWATLETFHAMKVHIDRIAGSEAAGNALVQEVVTFELAKEGEADVMVL